jgi:hypothetical protein
MRPSLPPGKHNPTFSVPGRTVACESVDLSVVPWYLTLREEDCTVMNAARKNLRAGARIPSERDEDLWQGV